MTNRASSTGTGSVMCNPSDKQTVHSTHALRIRGLSKTYTIAKNKKIEALKDINLEVNPGEIIGLLGRNGAGKSTFINIISGLVLKDKGEVNIFGHDLEKETLQFRKSIGIVPQELAVDPLFTPFEIVDFQAGLYGVPKKEHRTEALLTALGLKDKMHVPSRSLSGGMKRRVMIAKALVHRPPIIILDEPTAGVDIELRRSLWEYIVELNRTQGTTVILTTHYFQEAEEVCDKIAIINQGQLIKYDATQSIMHTTGNQKLDIKLALPLETPPEFPEEIQVNIVSPHELSLLYNETTTSMNRLFKMLINSGMNIQSIDHTTISLETAFENLTQTPSVFER
ncbi:ABC transporter ATP-binding protein [Vibrio ruber]|uniref:ABC transporter ATP-binding protein n=1 Tax=Vibrio ruber TaxID=184755 RepID=UPI0028932308|nr:ABC transporter ATP-binding protein [Vibrio ruber]WNJ96296.1 ABC transporter ATP-binding protein [Vibrio ruber]